MLHRRPALAVPLAAFVGAVIAAAPLSAARAAASDPLAGRWQDAHGNVYEFTVAGPDSLTGEIISGDVGVCLPAHIRVSGSGGSYEGLEAYHKVVNGACTSEFLGDGGITLRLEPGDASVDVTHSAPAGLGGCVNCQPEVWTRLGAVALLPTSGPTGALTVTASAAVAATSKNSGGEFPSAGVILGSLLALLVVLGVAAARFFRARPAEVPTTATPVNPFAGAGEPKANPFAGVGKPPAAGSVSTPETGGGSGGVGGVGGDAAGAGAALDLESPTTDFGGEFTGAEGPLGEKITPE